MDKIFIYRKGALGDTLSFIPFIYRLKDIYERVVFAGNYLYRGIFEDLDFVEYVDADSRETLNLLMGRKNGFSENTDEFFIFSKAPLGSNPKLRHFPPLPENGWFYEHPFKAVNMRFTEVPVYLPVTYCHELYEEIKGQKYFVFHPGSGGKDKIWPLENFLYLENLLNNCGYEVIYLLGEAEENYRDKMKGKRVCDNFSFKKLTFLLIYSSGFLGCDSGISHLAGLLNVSGWAVFGPSSPAVYRPWGNIKSVKANDKITGIDREYLADLIGAHIEKRRDIHSFRCDG